jgi:putative SOS response-associated peptidase YedK
VGTGRGSSAMALFIVQTVGPHGSAVPPYRKVATRTCDMSRPDDSPELPISWNVAPTQPVYAVATSSSGTRKLRALRWGLVPSWTRDPRIAARLINARSETLGQRPAFRSLVSTRRALLPVSGFYEWRRPDPGGSSLKQPFYFQRADGKPLVFAGLWDLWLDAQGRPLRSCTILTVAANKTMAPVHHRMPSFSLGKLGTSGCDLSRSAVPGSTSC